MTYENALSLTRKGHFQTVIDNLKRSVDGRDVSPPFKVLLAYVLALTNGGDASPFLNVDVARLKPHAFSQLETTLGLINWHSGDHEKAWHHFQAGVRLAREASEPERLAWAYLHLWRFAIEIHPIDPVMALLPDVRAAVIRAGARDATAYLHVCVSTLEGQRGHLDEALRHCEIAESLLSLEPNAWILGASYVNRSCVACLQCDFKEASEQVRKVIELVTISGNTGHRTAADNLSGYVHFLSGDFHKAEQILAGALLHSTRERARIDAADLLARVYLALHDLEKCESTLNQLGAVSDSSQIDTSTYGKRWACLTNAKLLLKRAQFEKALRYLQVIEARAIGIQDHPFNGAVHLLAAQALHRLGKQRECGHRILDADIAGIRHNADLQGQFSYTIGMLSGHEDVYLGRQLRERAQRIWESQGIISVKAEIQDDRAPDISPSPMQSLVTHESTRIRSAINGIAAAIDLADKPRLLGAELLNILGTTECGANASVIETVNGSSQNLERSGKRVTLRLGTGTHAQKSVFLLCHVPDSPADAVVLGDILRIAQAAIALRKARQDERSRAALWPSDPARDQGDALFLTEEMQTLLDTAHRIAAANIPLLITGETGTGKEVLARLIHSYSPRTTKPFLPFNCTATPRDMLDAQLFGHRRGAFTGATENFAGVIRGAAGGTLFLDEIGEAPLDIQPKLLRFLESSEVHPVGETHPQRVDVRVIAATNADIDALVSQGRFREDLFYRLNIVRLTIPPLRERRVEIPAFANHYLQKYAKEMDKADLRLAEETMEYLVLYRWPGNVRQIANEMRRLAALAEPGAVLMPEHLSPSITASRRTLPVSDRPLDAHEIVVRIDQPFGAAVQHLERAMVHAAVARTKSIDEAARLLGVSRKGLYNKRLRYGMEIDRPKSKTEVA